MPSLTLRVRDGCEAAGSFRGNLAVDQLQVDALPTAHEFRDHVKDDRQCVHRPHEDQRRAVVDAVGGVGEPLVDVPSYEDRGERRCDRDDRDTGDPVPADDRVFEQLALRHGKIMPAISVPKNVTAGTSTASSTNVLNSLV